jgi:Arc/MetJ family transcription regulator
VTKRLVEIDDDVLEAARTALETRTIKDTVERALKDAAAAAARRAFLERAYADGLADLRDADVKAAAWR